MGTGEARDLDGTGFGRDDAEFWTGKDIPPRAPSDEGFNRVPLNGTLYVPVIVSTYDQWAIIAKQI